MVITIGGVLIRFRTDPNIIATNTPAKWVTALDEAVSLDSVQRACGAGSTQS